MAQITRAKAEEMWARLCEGFANWEQALIDIIEAQAWLPMGYATFMEGWRANGLDKTKVGAAVMPHVVYQLLGEGMSAEDIAASVPGVGPETVEELGKQKEAGVPPQRARQRTQVRTHARSTPGTRHVVHVDLGGQLVREYQAVAAFFGTTVEDVLAECAKERFGQMRREMAEAVLAEQP